MSSLKDIPRKDYATIIKLIDYQLKNGYCSKRTRLIAELKKQK